MRVGLAFAATLTAGLVGLPASSVIASAQPPAGQAAVRTVEAVAPARPPIVLVDTSGLYKFNFGGRTGWLLLKHYLGSNTLFAWVHEDGHVRKIALTARYDYRSRLVRLSRIADGYRYEYYLWVAQKSPSDRLDFGGYVDRYPLRRTTSAPIYTAEQRDGASLSYIADDAD
jgi:hypothetical protein